ncbi:hypothetical protein CC86DRAFT_384087 [Ophiobolus disseminans]|uniref:Apple domain-containing protein n=1 Tax=Ophiobolus disseminans TaxID=1469910 RepID=A0A6A6ZTR7_9PLEO|nr:hypothetical protein CC86DRAFT_384087 [Ophiobolus disseminans]
MADAPQVAYNNHAAEKYPHHGVEPYYQHRAHYSYHAPDASGDTLGQKNQHVVEERAESSGSRRMFWILFILFELVLVGVIIGGSVGGTLAVQKAHKSTSCTNPSDSNAAALLPSSSSYPTPSAIQPSPLPSPSMAHASTSMPASSASTPSFAMYSALPFAAVHMINTTCPSSTLSFGADAPDLGSAYQYNCLANKNLRDADLTSFTAYTLEQCVDACSQWNAAHGNRGCKGVVISYRVMYKRQTGNGANCWLKSGAESQESSVDGTVAILV